MMYKWELNNELQYRSKTNDVCLVAHSSAVLNRSKMTHNDLQPIGRQGSNNFPATSSAVRDSPPGELE